MLSVACGRPFYPLRSFHGQPNRLVVRRSRASIVERGSPCRPWRSYRSGSLPPSSSSSRSRWNARPPGTDGDPAVESRVGSGSPSTSFLSLLCPLLKFFGGGDPSQERNEFLEVATSSLSSLARSPWGSKSLNNINNLESATSPQPYLQIYEFEACPFCRRVREAMTELDLTVEVYPCPKGSLRHRELVRSIGGKEQFPFLVDLNTGVSMYESNDIVKYLFRQYGQGRNPSFGLLERYHILLILTPDYKWVTIRRFCLTYSRHTLPVTSFSFASSLDCITQDVSLPFHAVSCAIYQTFAQLEKEVKKCMMPSNSFDKSKPVPLADRLHSTEKFHD
ncbi:uncharacterized protein LOC135607782 isoform X2 [Musa acuminata AAA Group]|uniref:uncharacterized protein LOC135607782 isoform X2 n=1 Tax=Musa acuminata AAA Group TaxID=214697 RepID=UPI0031DDF304